MRCSASGEHSGHAWERQDSAQANADGSGPQGQRETEIEEESRMSCYELQRANEASSAGFARQIVNTPGGAGAQRYND
jgi:hypothetical protein